MIEKTLGHYRVGEQLGRGGMGEVYLADDLNLNRKVALKFLPDAFATDPERMARFEREAKLLASLNHPNIAAIYGLEQAEGKRFLVLELVEGETLAQRISKGALPVDEALGICRQIAEGLEAAHEKGVIHRDLKPANVMITEGDKVKILDFGLAKALSDETQSVDSSQSPTLTEAMTRPGVILGTAAYMSPEQAKGKSVDKRADIWAFGCILYECLTGKRAFEGETVTETLAAVLKGEPDWQALSGAIHSNIRMLLRRCLNKEPRNRLQAIGDIRIELETLNYEPLPAVSGPVPIQPPPKRFLYWLVAIAGLAGILISAFIFNWLRPPQPKISELSRPLVHAAIDLPKELPLALGSHIPLVGYNSPILSLASDGRYLAYVGKSGSETILCLINMSTSAIRPVPGTEGAIYAFFSPDTKWLGFLTNDKVKKVDLQSGAPITLCEARTPVLAWWTRENLIYFTEHETGQVSRVPADGGAAASILLASDIGLSGFSDVLPDGKWILAILRNGIGCDHADIYLVNAETKEKKLLIRSGYGARYVAPGYLLFARAGCLMAAFFDADRREVLGESISIAAGTDMESLLRQVHASSSSNGLLAYIPGGDLSIGSLAIVDRKGNTEYLQAPARVYGEVDLAPDGKKLAIHVADVQDYVWIYDMARKEGRRLPGVDHNGYPSWSPDGQRIAVTSSSMDKRSIVLRDPNEGVNTTPGQIIAAVSGYVNSWSPDGRVLAVGATGNRTKFVSLDSSVAPTGFDGSFTGFSPDGRYVAYCSNQSGQNEVYIRSYLDGKVNRQVSIDGGFEPRWKASGELFYRKGNHWFSTHVSTVPEPHWDPPRSAFETEFIDTPGMSYDVTPDGQHLLVVKRAQAISANRIDLLMNWFEELKQRVPVK